MGKQRKPYDGRFYRVLRRGRRYIVEHKETGQAYGKDIGGWMSLKGLNKAARQWDKEETRRRTEGNGV